MEKDAYYYYQVANELYKSGQIEEAIKAFLKSLNMDYHFKTYEKLYWCYHSLQQYDLANYFIKRAYEENNQNDKVAFLYAKVLIEKNELKVAREILSSIIVRNPNYKKAQQEYQKLQGTMETADSKDNCSAFVSVEYDRKIRKTLPYYEEFYNQIIDLIQVYNPKQLSWLDIGCGTGKMAEKAQLHFVIDRFVFVDNSESMLNMAKELYGSLDTKTEFYLCDALDLAYGEEFDVVTAILINHYFHKEEKLKALKKYYDALKPNGIYIGFENFLPDSAYGKQLGLKRWKEYQLRQGKSIDECEKHMSRCGAAYFPITLSEQLELLKLAGFEVAEILWVSNMQAGVFGIKKC